MKGEVGCRDVKKPSRHPALKAREGFHRGHEDTVWEVDPPCFTALICQTPPNYLEKLLLSFQFHFRVSKRSPLPLLIR